MLRAELLRLKSEGIEGISLIRAVLRRMMLLARLRAEVERGSSVGAVMAAQGKSIFWKEKEAVAAQLSRWRSDLIRSEEHTSELQSLMRISYAVFCLKKKKKQQHKTKK